MTYGMILLTVGISFFFISLMTAFYIWRFNVRTKKMVEQVHILQDMMDYDIFHKGCEIVFDEEE